MKKKIFFPSIFVLGLASFIAYQYFKKENFTLEQMTIDPQEKNEQSESSSSAQDGLPKKDSYIFDKKGNEKVQKTEPTQEIVEDETEEIDEDSPFPTITIKKKKVENLEDEEEDDEESTGLMQGISHKEINQAVEKFKDIDPELGKEVEEHVKAPEDEDLDLDDF